MRTANWLKMAMAVVMVSACDVVESTVPMGLEPATLSPEDWEGLWLGDEGVLAITVTDAEAGRLTASFLGEDRAETPPHGLATYDVIVRRSGHWLFANTHHEESSEWSWLRVKLEGDQLIAWFPDPQAFKSLVSGGILPGTITDSDDGKRIVLDPLTPDQDQLIRGRSEGVLLGWEWPLIFVRIRNSVS